MKFLAYFTLVSALIFSASCSKSITFELVDHSVILLGTEDFFLVVTTPDTFSSFRVSDGKEVFSIRNDEIGTYTKTQKVSSFFELRSSFLGFDGRAFFFSEKGLCSVNLATAEYCLEIPIRDGSFASHSVSNQGNVIVRAKNELYLCSLKENTLDGLFPAKGDISGEVLENSFLLWTDSDVKLYDMATHVLLSSHHFGSDILELVVDSQRILVYSSDEEVKILSTDSLREIGTVFDFFSAPDSHFFLVENNRFIVQYANSFEKYEHPAIADGNFNISKQKASVGCFHCDLSFSLSAYFYRDLVWEIVRNELSGEKELISHKLKLLFK